MPQNFWGQVYFKDIHGTFIHFLSLQSIFQVAFKEIKNTVTLRWCVVKPLKFLRTRKILFLSQIAVFSPKLISLY